MATEKIAVTIDKHLLERLDDWVARLGNHSRSRVVQEAIAEKLERVEKGRLARECEKLDPAGERELAELGLAEDLKQWPKY